MSDPSTDNATLDRAYADGRLVGFFGLATSAGCPFLGDEIDLRIAWLDGFDYGRWEAESARGLEGILRQAEFEEPEPDADTAIAHLLHLSQQARTVPVGAGLGQPGIDPAAGFASLVGLNRIAGGPAFNAGGA